MRLEELLEVLEDMHEKHGDVRVRIGNNLNYLRDVSFDDILNVVVIHGQQ